MKNRNLQHSDQWATPPDLYAKLNEVHHFNFDPCPLNPDPDFDGLRVEWGTSNFVNPPYSAKLKAAFVDKAIIELLKGKKSVFLLPVSTSTSLFHDKILPNAYKIDFIKGRIRFGKLQDDNTVNFQGSGMFDSMIVTFCPSIKSINNG